MGPRGWPTEAGLAPWLSEFGLLERPEGETEAERYRAGRHRCARDWDAAVIFGDLLTPGSRGFILGTVAPSGSLGRTYRPV